MIAAKHVGKAHATSIFLFRERSTDAAERTPGARCLDREMAPVGREYTMEKREKQEKYPARIGPDKIYLVTITRT